MDMKLHLALVAALGLVAGAACTTTGTSGEGSETDTESTTTSPSTNEDTTGSGSESATPYGTESPTGSTTGTESPTTSSADSESGMTGSSETAAADQSSASEAMPDQSEPGGSVPGQDMLGRQVVTAQGEPLGTIVQMVVDTNSQPAYVVISTGAEAAVVPYPVVSAMVQGDQIVMDRNRLEGAPKVQGDLRAETSDEWRSAADSYWGGAQSPIRTATPETPESEQEDDTSMQ